MTQTAETDYGLIDETTPVGRCFELDSGGTMTLVSFDGEAVRAVHSDDGPDGVRMVGIDDWKNHYAPDCIGYIDPITDEQREAESQQALDGNPTPPDELGGDTVSPELLSELRDLNEDYHKASADYEEANDIAKAMKKLMEHAQLRLNGICDRITTKAPSGPLFDRENEAAGTNVSATDDSVDSGAWCRVRLDSLAEPGISERYLQSLAENVPAITTLGDLVDWQESKGDFWAKDITGLGEVGQTEIALATEAFWSRNNDKPAKR